jgi:predicted NBD/HSP70 family sugar kinase
VDFQPGEGALAALERIAAGFERLLARGGGFVAGVGLSLPAPVDHRAGRVVGPSILHGWDDFAIGDWLRDRFDAPAVAENDVNLMTLFEHRGGERRDDAFLFVKIGTGIGSGIVTDGRLYRGAQGAAGDIGHIQFFGDDAPPLCRCGKLGCLEARAAGWALARDLRALGFEAEDARDVIALVNREVPEAIALVRGAGQAVGAALSDAVSILNPGHVAIGGTLAQAGDHLMDGIRETIRERCLPLATRDLVLTHAPTSDEACLIGAAVCVRERIFAADGVDRFLARYGAWMAARA